MVRHFQAFVVDEPPGSGRIESLTLADLPDESVLVEVAYSSLNYKDALAVTGNGKIARKFPMVCGIDLAGKVLESADPRFMPGDNVAAIGSGLSEHMWGGYAGCMRVKPDVLFKIPEPFDAKEIMAIGTAGYTAMVGIMMLEKAGMSPERGEVLVTGAGGGVGSIAITVLASLGYRVVASSGRVELSDYFKWLGAAEIIPRAELDRIPKPLEKGRWGGALDSVGSKTLATVLATTKEMGCVGACGLAGGSDLPTNVMPFILRGVRLIGVNYYLQPEGTREVAWARLANEFPAEKRSAMTRMEPLSRIRGLSEEILAGRIRGRVVIDVRA